jgi:hypothetical protein
VRLHGELKPRPVAVLAIGAAVCEAPRGMARSRVLEPSPIGLIGGVLALIACFLAWGGYDDSFDVPLQFLWDKDASGGVKLGIPLVSVAAVAALFSLSAIEPFVFLRRLGGVVLLGATALFVVQLGRRIGWDNLSADNVDVGPYLAGGGGLLALLAPSGLWPFTRRRPRRAPARPEAAPPPPPPVEAPPTMPAGWYSDPEGGGQRYWDGKNWTEHRAG